MVDYYRQFQISTGWGGVGKGASEYTYHKPGKMAVFVPQVLTSVLITS